ncbi:MAG: rhomboid family intramembrane serine protease [Oscillatoriales cyanobacterium C42_A2020_001]|nr:rhomboid family intramembrane serine protease [Leptolyngbyaceae cyanobacterium C42_A2020_001]
MRGRQKERSIADELKFQILILGGCVAIAWGLELFDLLVLKGGYNFGGGLDQYGIIPRNPIGLRGILFAPFLHGGLGHLIGNTIPFLILGWLVMLRETTDFFVVSIISALVSGSGTWMFGTPGIHLGASGVIFGYLGYLLARGYFERSGFAIAMSLFVGALYGSLIWGVLPLQQGISWEGHLFGFIGGIVSAKLLADDRRSVGG